MKTNPTITSLDNQVQEIDRLAEGLRAYVRKENDVERVIKFRAWDSKANGWFPFSHLEMLAIFNLHDSHFKSEVNRATPYLTFEQFTGLLDKNGEDIYEGDVIEVVYKTPFPKERGYMVFNAKKGRFCLQLNEGEPYGLTTNDSHNEVIGNIHESPELLEVTP